MTLSKFRMKTFRIACALAVIGGLAGCGASDVPAGSVSTAGTGSAGSSAPETISGITTPKSVSVVTAN